jgi:hypothetical protein
MKSQMYKPIVYLIILSALFLSACAPDQAEYYQPEAPGDYSVEEMNDDSGSDNSYVSGIPHSTERLVIMNAEMTIEVEDPSVAMDVIAQMAQTSGGFVVSSNLSQRIGAKGIEVDYATITIRIPAKNLTQSLKSIEALAVKVLSKNQSGQDVTKEYTDLQSRLRNLEDAEEQLRQIMENSEKTEDVLSVYRELTKVTENAEVIRGQIKYYDESIAYSAVSLTLITHEELEPVTIGGWEPAGIARNAIQALVDALQFIVNILIWLLLFVVPVLLVLSLPFVAVSRIYKAFKKKKSKGKAGDN